MNKDFVGIDFGSQNTLIYSSSAQEVVYNEPTCLAIDAFNHKVLETGFLASKIQGKTPYNYQVVYPVIDGLVDDIDLAVEYLSLVLAKFRLDRSFKGIGLVFSAPSKCSKVNRSALVEIGKRLQAKEIYLESQVKLAAIGAGENVYAPTATLVCNLGQGITDIGCLSMGELVSSETTSIAGKAMDEAIRRYLIQEKHLAVGKKTSEYVKMRIGTLSPLSDSQLVEVKGRDTITSLPSSTVISSSEIRQCLLPLASFIALKITDVISSLPPDLASDLVHNGLILTGGSALLGGLRDYLQNTLSIPVRIADEPSNAVIKGMAGFISKLSTR
jgi:rod shape-determining protein MreB